MLGILGEDIQNAVNVLFGRRYEISVEFLRALTPSVLKSAFRKKAFESHPDLAYSLGKSKAEMNERFKELGQAYEYLNSVVARVRYDFQPEARKSAINAGGKEKGASPERPGTSDHFYQGPMPGRRLLMGQFLYYSGLISWRTLIKGIVWQRRQRPLIGQIARKWGIMTEEEIRIVLATKGSRERFGQCALREGYITHFELFALLGRQKRLQRPIGEYFMENGGLSPEELEGILDRLRTHNGHVSRFSSMRGGFRH